MHQWPFFPDPGYEERLDQFVGRQGAGVELLRTLGDTVHKCFVPIAIISHKCLPILEHGLGGLLGVVKGVVFFAQVILDDANLRAQGTQRFAVLGVVHTQRPGNALCHADNILIGRIDRGQPLGQQRHRLASLQGGTVSVQLLFDELQHLVLAGRAHQGQQIIAAAILRDVLDVFLQGSRLVAGQPLENGTEDATLADAAPNISCEEQSLHGQIRILGISTEEPICDLLVAFSAKAANGGE